MTLVAEWRDQTLGEVLTLQRGFDLPARDRVDGPVPIVSSSGVTGRHNVGKVDPPGVVIGRYGTLGQVHWVTERYWPLNTALWVKDFKGNDPRFVSYLLRTVSADGSAASAVPGVNRNHLHRLPVRIPSVPTQRRIAAMLAAFGDLIEVNERRIAVLEDLARSLYHEWFVRFRFASRPESPTTTTIGALAEPLRGSTNPCKQPYVDFEHFSIPAFDAGQIPVRELGEAIKSNKTPIPRECVLVSKLNPRIPRVWFAVPETATAVASTEFSRGAAHPYQTCGSGPPSAAPNSPAASLGRRAVPRRVTNV